MNLKSKIRVIPDFPKKGISFKDITTLLANAEAFKYMIDKFAEKCKDKKIDLVVGPEARGFLIGSALAYKLGAGFVPIRKPGKLPSKTLKVEYQLEYGSDQLEMHIDAIKKGQNVLIVDDLLATGGTISAVVNLVEKSEANVSGVYFLVELIELGGKEDLKDYDVFSLVEYPY